MAEQTTYVAARCRQNAQDSVIRLELRSGQWWAAHGAPTAPWESQGTPTAVSGGIWSAPEYACPYCEAHNFMRCGSCGKLTCWKPADSVAVCRWCGNTGPVSGSIDSVDTFLG